MAVTGFARGRKPNVESIPEEEQVENVPPPLKPLGEDGLFLWVYIWSEGKEKLTTLDAMLVQELCEAEDELEQFRTELKLNNRGKAYTTSATGYVQIHPLQTEINKLKTQKNAMLSELGFTPASRSKMKLEEIDRVEELLVTLKERRAPGTKESF